MTELSIGLPRMHKEPGERRDFLPRFVHRLAKLGLDVVLEHDYGAGMKIKPDRYLAKHPNIRFADHDETYQQDYVLVLRYPTDDELRLMRRGACLISMVHYPTRPGRVAYLRELGLEAMSLDSVKDDLGRRLIENLRSVGWNGVEAAFQALGTVMDLENPERQPIQVTLLGSGAVGGFAMQAAVRYGDVDLWQRLAQSGFPGVVVTVVDYDVAWVEAVMLDILKRTDILIDATQRPDPSKIAIPNEWVAHLPEHAVLLDLSVDPYDCSQSPPAVKAIEAVPHGTLDQYIFPPDDPAFDAIPDCVDTTHRRTAVSCYSWPGVHPKACMEVYGQQIFTLIRRIIEAGGIQNINPQGKYFHRAIARATLSHWEAGSSGSQ